MGEKPELFEAFWADHLNYKKNLKCYEAMTKS
jgi:hypothetical protein